MNRDDRRTAALLVEQWDSWERRRARLLERIRDVDRAASEVWDSMSHQVRDLETAEDAAHDRTSWSVLTLSDDVIRDIASYPTLRHAQEQVEGLITGFELLHEATESVERIRPVLGLFGGFQSRQVKATAADGLPLLSSTMDHLTSDGFAERLERAEVTVSEATATLGTAARGRTVTEHDQRAAFSLLTSPDTPYPAPFDRERMRTAHKDAGALVVISEWGQEAVEVAVGQADGVRAEHAERMVAALPVERLRDVSDERLRIAALEDIGITTVGQVRDQAHRLRAVPGIGPRSAHHLVAAASTLFREADRGSGVVFDPDHPSEAATNLLRSILAFERGRLVEESGLERPLLFALMTVSSDLIDQARLFTVVPQHRTRAEFEALVDRVHEVAKQAMAGGAPNQWTADALWEDFSSRPAHYYALLAEMGVQTEVAGSTEGALPDDVVKRVRQQDLDTSRLNASLRGYQHFAARFAVVQRKVLIGDEMGLGKTVEALAAVTHLAAQGETHFLVICPAAVLPNWLREVERHTTLRTERIHGTDRDVAALQWHALGGVAVTTFDTLRAMGRSISETPLSLVIVDEAQYVKNAGTQRHRNVRAQVERADRAILLSGTPLENRVQDFTTLVSLLDPKALPDGRHRSPAAFRQAVAPVYLRRNQEDVLTELPEQVDVPEVIPFSPADEAAYRDALLERNFMQLRRAGFAAGPRSEKLSRLLDIAAEAEENGRRVVVFSFFRSVLETIQQHLPHLAFGPITGSIPADQRQEIVDDFSAAPHGAVLLAQIHAGGTGLNIQAASVVVLCEPQLQPAIEAQAIARAKRMGQLRSVVVHRLLNEEGVDQRLTALLAEKRRLFDEYARQSQLADATPEAVDISNHQLAEEVIAAERVRLGLDVPVDAPDLPVVPDCPDRPSAGSEAETPGGATPGPTPQQQPAQTGLFPPAAEEGWGGTVVGSEAFAWQLEVVPRLSVTPDQVGQALDALIAAPGERMLASDMARGLGMDPAAGQGIVMQLQQYLNVEGAPVLRLEQDRVLLDLPVLREVFEVDGP